MRYPDHGSGTCAAPPGLRMITDLGPTRIGINPDKGWFQGSSHSAETYQTTPLCCARYRPKTPIRCSYTSTMWGLDASRARSAVHPKLLACYGHSTHRRLALHSLGRQRIVPHGGSDRPTKGPHEAVLASATDSPRQDRFDSLSPCLWCQHASSRSWQRVMPAWKLFRP